VVGDPIDLDVRELEWDETNVRHVLEHGVSREEVEEVLARAPQFYINLPSRSGTHVMLGPDDRERFLYVVLVESVRSGNWRVVTAYRYNRRRALRLYRSN
jgi:uncharacterized DUF497 family protein